MPIQRHGRATTTPKARAAIQAGDEPARILASPGPSIPRAATAVEQVSVPVCAFSGGGSFP